MEDFDLEMRGDLNLEPMEEPMAPNWSGYMGWHPKPGQREGTKPTGVRRGGGPREKEETKLDLALGSAEANSKEPISWIWGDENQIWGRYDELRHGESSAPILSKEQPKDGIIWMKSTSEYLLIASKPNLEVITPVNPIKTAIATKPNLWN